MDPTTARLECLRLAADVAKHQNTPVADIQGTAEKWSTFVIGETPKESKSSYGKGADDPKK